MCYSARNLILILIVLSATVSFAQKQRLNCNHLKSHFAGKKTVDDSEENNYDIKYIKLDISVSNTSTSINGCCTTMAKVLATTLNRYVFELIPDYTIDSVLVNGVSCPYTTVADVRYATLSAPLSAGQMFTARVFYHGAATSGTPYSSLGINNFLDSPAMVRLTFTLSESYHAKEWWPCKQSLQDKIDSADIWITVPSTLKAGSNGILDTVVAVDASHMRYQWKERNPIDYYLISLAVAPYTEHSYYMHFSGSSDSMLIKNYIYALSAGEMTWLDSVGYLVDYFSSIYGRYPFWHEKYGHCLAPIGGGMEHQTMTTLSSFDLSLVAHELGHQWFGDNVTCRTWSNIFANEGFASYTEDLFFEHFEGAYTLLADITQKQADVLMYDTGTIYCPDTTEDRIFDYRLSYEKGACVLHMLRFFVGNDSLFFLAYRTYQANLAGTTGSIDDVKTAFETVLGPNVNGIRLDTFFNQWFYGQGFPIYRLYWYQLGSDVYLKLTQTTSVPSSVTFFPMLANIMLQSGSGDTLVEVLNNADTQFYHFNWGLPITGITFDPGHRLLYKMDGGARYYPQLSASGNSSISPEHIVVYPNPVQDYWHLDGLQPGTDVRIFDCTGRLLIDKNSESLSDFQIYVGQLQSGVYIAKIYEPNGACTQTKLLKN